VPVEAIRDLTGRAELRTEALRAPLAGAPETAGAAPAGKPKFADLVTGFVRDVNSLQFQAGHAIDQMMTGEAADVHQVMVAVEEAGIALDLMIEIRNRVLEGYQELIRMQL
jgi:flagellar hook-basal body complex protein FliE